MHNDFDIYKITEEVTGEEEQQASQDPHMIKKS